MSKSRRDAKMAQALENAEGFLAIAYPVVFEWLDTQRGNKITGEQLRLAVRKKAGDPHVQQVWGAFTNSLVKKGFLKDTGRTTHATDRPSNACRIPIWKVL